MDDTTEQASSSENETHAVATNNNNGAGFGLRLADVEDNSVWEAYRRWRNPHT